MNKKKINYILLILIVSTVYLSTLSYFTASKRVKNIITTGSVDLEIIETDEKGNPFPSSGIFNVLPASTITKDVKVKNTGLHPMWIRVAVEINFLDNTLDESVVSLNYNNQDWIYKDNYFYYNKILYPNKTTESLFDTVNFKETMGNEYKNASLIINIHADGVQSEFNGDEVTKIKWK